jgi:RNA polymerase sigma-70 factor, ECF subfamily
MDAEPITQLLWRKASQGDVASYDELFSLHVDRALLFIRLRLGGLREKVEAEDVLQEAYLAAHRDFAQFEYAGEGSFLRWLCRIIDNRLRDSHDYFAAAKRQAIPLARSAPTGPATALGKAESREQVQQALLALSEEHRQVILLRYFEGLSAEETGERMQRSSGAVRSLTARALVELGKQLTHGKGHS